VIIFINCLFVSFLNSFYHLGLFLVNPDALPTFNPNQLRFTVKSKLVSKLL
jgi:hypothetical protein